MPEPNVLLASVCMCAHTHTYVSGRNRCLAQCTAYHLFRPSTFFLFRVSLSASEPLQSSRLNWTGQPRNLPCHVTPMYPYGRCVLFFLLFYPAALRITPLFVLFNSRSFVFLFPFSLMIHTPFLGFLGYGEGGEGGLTWFMHMCVYSTRTC